MSFKRNLFFFLFLLIVLTGCSKKALIDHDKEIVVRIALEHKVKEAFITSKSNFKLITQEGDLELNPNDTCFIYSGYEYPLVYINRKKRIVLKYYPLKFVSTEKNGFLIYKGMVYRGEIFLIKDVDNFILPINRLYMEDYLKGVVPAEIGKLDKKRIEALKAQAVAARTYAFGRLNKNYDMGYDLESSVQDQVYRGVLVEDSLVNLAIEMTRGIVAVYKGFPIDAKYHSTCGGFTSNNEDEWGGTPSPYLRSVVDAQKSCLFGYGKPYCYKSKHSNWGYQFEKDYFYRMVSKNASSIFKKDLQITKFSIKKYDKHKRVVEVELLDIYGERYAVKGLSIRKLITFDEYQGGFLKSRMFDFEEKNDKIFIYGKGYGHGVGMCQYGAMEMANQGKNYREILKHYYRGIELKKLY
ncbi:MAG: SpoIID/LytB domain-containing protein [candidate division WOR-3 bacterium]